MLALLKFIIGLVFFGVFQPHTLNERTRKFLNNYSLHTHRLIGRLIDWLIDWLIVRLIDWLIDWLIEDLISAVRINLI